MWKFLEIVVLTSKLWEVAKWTKIPLVGVLGEPPPNSVGPKILDSRFSQNGPKYPYWAFGAATPNSQWAQKNWIRVWPLSKVKQPRSDYVWLSTIHFNLHTLLSTIYLCYIVQHNHLTYFIHVFVLVVVDKYKKKILFIYMTKVKIRITKVGVLKSTPFGVRAPN